MSIIDDYKQLQIIENVKKIKEMELCYKANLKLCKQQEKQINKLATCIEEIKEIAEYELNNLTDSTIHGGRYLEILDKISECGAENENS